MNQKNSLGLDNCFNELENPIELFNEWFNEAKKTELNDPNALSLATADKNGTPSVRIVLLKDFGENGGRKIVLSVSIEGGKGTFIIIENAETNFGNDPGKKENGYPRTVNRINKTYEEEVEKSNT